MANDKFSSGKYTYPLNIEADEYGGNFVMYQIGVSGKSKNSQSVTDALTGESFSPLSPSSAKNSNLSGLGLNEETSSSYVQALPYAAAAGFGGIGLAGENAGVIVASAKSIGGLITQFVGDISATNYLILKESICLYMPDVSIKYSASWEDKPLASQAMLQKVSQTLVDNKLLENLAVAYIGGGVTGALFGGNETIKKAVQAGAMLSVLDSNKDLLGNLSEGIIKNLALSLEPTQIIQKQAGIARNPLSELLFTNIDRRTFTHKFSFFPRSKAEADSVREIIRLFKYHMHPEYIPNNYNLNYIYPSEFYISYYTNNQPSNTLPKHAACALTSLDVDYSKGDQFSTLKDGTPTEITMTLGFSELALLTKESFGEEGGNLS